MPSLEETKTELLFWDKPYQKEFQAKIIEITANGIILDRTLFFPEGGGQFSDQGFCIVEEGNQKIKILSVEKINGNIIHRITKKDSMKIQIGDRLNCSIDWLRRYKIMKAHSSQHILSAMIVKHAGVETTKAIIDENGVTIHLEEKITKEVLEKAVIETKNMILSNKNIKTEFFTKEKLPEDIKKGLRGNIEEITAEKLRVVSIEGIDYSLCGGTHCKRTLEIGNIAIVDFKGNIIHYLFGDEAMKFNTLLEMDAISTAKLLASKPEEVHHRIVKILEELEELKIDNSLLTKIVVEYQLNKQKENPKKIGSWSIIEARFPFAQKKFVLQELGDLEKDQIAVLVIKGPIVVVVTSKDGLQAKEIVLEFCEKTGNKGGGSPTIAQASIDDIDKEIEIIIEIIKKRKH